MKDFPLLVVAESRQTASKHWTKDLQKKVIREIRICTPLMPRFFSRSLIFRGRVGKDPLSSYLLDIFKHDYLSLPSVLSET